MRDFLSHVPVFAFVLTAVKIIIIITIIIRTYVLRSYNLKCVTVETFLYSRCLDHFIVPLL